MIDQVKKAALNQAMKLLSNPKLGEWLSDPRFTGAISKGLELHDQFRTNVESGIRNLTDSLNLASKDDLGSLRQKLNQVEHHVGDLETKLSAKAPKKRSPRKKKTPTA